MLDILRPQIFDRMKLQSGVTQKNQRIFPKTGLSLSPAKILDDAQYNMHLQIFAHSRGIASHRIKYNQQVHSDIVRIVDGHSNTEEADALITNEKQLMLLVKIADCAAILLYDRKRQVIAAIHSGWRGTKANIVEKSINLMKQNFGTDSKSIMAYVSPSASVKHYQVGEEFLTFFPNVIIKRGNKYYFDNKKLITEQLLSAGVSKSHIEVSDICTIADNDYHSYRRDGDCSGRMGAFIMLK